MLVTGATGFIGSHVARLLVERGDEVRLGVEDGSPDAGIADLDCKRVRLDVRDRRSVRRALKGVERVFALQAGREVRVMVKPGEVDDDTAVLLSHEIAREIEEQLEYPGQIKVTVIRESRSVEFAK